MRNKKRQKAKINIKQTSYKPSTTDYITTPRNLILTFHITTNQTMKAEKQKSQ